MKFVSLRVAILTLGFGVATVSGPTYAAETLQPSTKKDLTTAMHEEAFAILKYMAYADAARANGNVALADLFDTIANIERQNHFAAHAKQAGLVGSDAENLKNAISSESRETSGMYPAMARRAEAAGDMVEAQRFREIGADEAQHRDAFQVTLSRLETQ